jgi:hypothetical protein
MDFIADLVLKGEKMMFRRRGAPWLPLLLAGGIGAAMASKRARMYGRHGWQGQSQAGYGPPRRIPPMFEEILNTWHKQAHGESPPTGEKPAGGETTPPQGQ